MKITNGYENLSVSLENIHELTGNLWRESLFDFVKITWRSLQDQKYDPANAEHNKLVDGAFTGHVLPTILEGIRFKFNIKNMSRACSHQFVRGRIGWAYNQESQAPESILDRDISLPMTIYRDDELRKQAEEIAEKVSAFYEACLAKGVPNHFSRYMVPEGSNTNIYCVVSFPALRGMMNNRTCLSTSDEINIVARMMRVEVLKAIPELEPFLHQACDRGGKCTLVDTLFPCCTKYNHEPLPGTKYLWRSHKNPVMNELERRPELMVKNDEGAVVLATTVQRRLIAKEDAMIVHDKQNPQ